VVVAYKHLYFDMKNSVVDTKQKQRRHLK